MSDIFYNNTKIFPTLEGEFALIYHNGETEIVECFKTMQEAQNALSFTLAFLMSFEESD